MVSIIGKERHGMSLALEKECEELHKKGYKILVINSERREEIRWKK